MASQVPGFATSFTELAMALLSASEVVPRARLIAQQVAELVPGSGVVVYVLDRSGDPVWAPKATAGEVAFERAAIAFDSGTLGALGEKREAVVFSGSRLRREQYSHLNVRRTIASLVGLPMLAGDELVGAIEVLSFDAPIQESSLPPLVELARLGGLGLAAGSAYESERNAGLESITRLTALYDLERSFNSTLEMDDLLPLIASKYQELLKVQAVSIWLVEGEAVRLMSRAGIDPTVELQTVQHGGEGLTGDLADIGEPVIINPDSDPRLQARNEGVEEGAIFSFMAAPLLHEGAEVGLVECINKLDGTPFDEDDLFFLTTVNVTASSALHNASLLLAERKVEILEALVKVSTELSSTLNLDVVLQAVVNEPHHVIPYERAAISLEERGRVQLKAVSGMPVVNMGDPQISRLRQMLEWASFLGGEVYVSERDGEIDEPREETKAKFREHFEQTGMRSFYALPLADDQGRVGVLSFESSNPDFLTPAHIEMIKILASQATVALRNASLYRDVPLIGLIEPLLQKKAKFMALGHRRRKAYLGLAAAVLLFLVAVPIPMRLDGDAVVAPLHTAQVQPEVDGLVRQVYVREGDGVARGAILAELQDWDYRAELAAAEAKYNTAMSSMNRALAANDGTEAGTQRIHLDYWAAEMQRARERLERTKLRAPIAGVVATPHVENFVGRRLVHGDTFAEIVDTSQAWVDVAISEDQVALLEKGASASVKLDSFPTRTFKGTVEIVSPRGKAVEHSQFFYARVEVPNRDGEIRSGMQGRGKVSARWHPAGYVLFRGTAMWIQEKLWAWFGW